MEIDEEKKAYANRLFQCLAISTRPLRVKELAEIFAVLPDAESALGFKFNISWRPQDPEEFMTLRLLHVGHCCPQLQRRLRL